MDVSNLFSLFSKTCTTENYKYVRDSLVISILAILLFSCRRLIYNILSWNMYDSIVLVSSDILLKKSL